MWFVASCDQVRLIGELKILDAGGLPFPVRVDVQHTRVPETLFKHGNITLNMQPMGSSHDDDLLVLFTEAVCAAVFRCLSIIGTRR